MDQNKQAIFLDVGNTLRVLLDDRLHKAEAKQKLAALVGAKESPEDFCHLLDDRYTSYRVWAFKNLQEAPERELWTRWLLPDYPKDLITPLANELTYQYRQSMGRRVMMPDGKKVVIELHKRGYILGIISNVITTCEIPDWLKEEGLAGYFQAVVLSSVFGKRKPDPEVFLEAARRAGVEPSQAVYVADKPHRDVSGPRNAGFKRVIIMLDPKDKDKPIAAEHMPDLFIESLNELLIHFPPLAGR